MNLRSFGSLVVGALVSSSAAFAVMAQDGHEGHDHGGGYSDDTQSPMEAWIKAGTPGENHSILAVFAGSWDVAGKFWMTADAPVTESKSKATTKWILGGRYLESSVHGNVMGMPFEGRSLVGYDNIKKHYFSTWVDNMGTSIMIDTGSFDKGSRTFNYKGEMTEPSGRTVQTKSVVKVISETKHVMTMYMTGEDGKMFKHMELIYTRSSASATETK